MARYLFDTNVFQAIADGDDPGKGGVPPSVASKVRAAIRSTGSAIMATVETLYELFAHINVKERNRYPHFYATICVLLEYTDGQLLDCADYTLQKAVLKEPKQPSVIEKALRMCRFLRDIQCFDDLYSNPYWYETSNGVLYPLLTHFELMRNRELSVWRRNWATNMIRVAEQKFWPDYTAMIARGETPRIGDETTRLEALRTLDSPQTLMVMMAGMATRAGATPPLTEEMFHKLSEGLCAFYCAYRGIWRKCIENGYNFLKPRNMNDLVDMLILMHLIDREVVVVTNDSRLVDLIPASCAQYGRTITFSQLCDLLDVT